MQGPSAVFGFRQTRLLWQLVLAVWLVSTAVHLPPVMVLDTAMAEATAGLPGDDNLIPEGDLYLIRQEVLYEKAEQVLVLSGAGLLIWWLWTVLWQAGVVSWQVWVGGRKVRLGEVIGLGISSWWRFFRLSLTATAGLLLSLSLVWLPLLLLVRSAYRADAGVRLLVLLVTGAVLSLLIIVLVCTATLWGVWLLGVPGSRSAVTSWLRGLVSAVRTPLSTVATMVAWALPIMIVTVLPLYLGSEIAWLQGTVANLVVTLTADLLRSFCLVALLCSFAPVTGLWVDEGTLDGDSRR
jgi:hypothetical protein